MFDVSDVEAFLQYCEYERRLSSHTVQAYKCDLADFQRWVRSQDQSASVTADLLKIYLADLVGSRKLSAATVCRRFACLRAFFLHQFRTGKSNDPFYNWRPHLPRRRHLPRALSRQEIRLLVTSADKEKISETSITIRLLVATGIRVGELCHLRVEHISPSGDWIRVHGKGSRERIVYVGDQALRNELQSLVQRRTVSKGSLAPLLLNRNGSPIKPQSIRSRLRALAKDVGILRRVTPHMLRHTAATLLIETGTDIRFVQRLLGHSSIATTEIYTHISDEALKISLERANVLGTIGRL